MSLSIVLVCTRVTVVLLVACLATCAAGSCLSYGHSCWGAHGKRSGTSNDGQWFISKLAPDNSWKPRRTMLPLPMESSALRHLNINENTLEGAENAAMDLLSADGDYAEDDEDNPAAYNPVGENPAGARPQMLAKEKPVIVMEQSPRLYKLLNQARKMDLSNVNSRSL